MLHNRFAGDALAKVDRLYKAGCDHERADCAVQGRSMTETSWNTVWKSCRNMRLYLQSVSVVPVGLSKYREGLYPLEPFDKEDAKKSGSDQVERWQKIMVKKYGIHFIHASDEWYILAGQ